MNNTTYKICRAIVRFIFMLFSPVRASGLENIPDGPVILAANHMSLTDPLKMACVVERPISFMAKKELFGIWGIKSFLKAIGAFPVDRSGGDFSAVKHAITVLQSGKLFGIFPQGTRTYKGGAQFKTGVALISARTSAAVVPVYIDGRTGLFRTTRLYFGKPLDLRETLKRPTSEALSEATSRVESAVYALGGAQSPVNKQ